MFNTPPQITPFKLLNSAQLVKLKQKALRAGVWYRSLQRIDRVLVDLTIKTVQDIRSAKLVKSLLSVIRKLEGCLENKIMRYIREVGISMAKKLSMFAQNWGNTNAEEWVNDLGYARYWAVMKLNG